MSGELIYPTADLHSDFETVSSRVSKNITTEDSHFETSFGELLNKPAKDRTDVPVAKLADQKEIKKSGALHARKEKTVESREESLAKIASDLVLYENIIRSFSPGQIVIPKKEIEKLTGLVERIKARRSELLAALASTREKLISNDSDIEVVRSLSATIKNKMFSFLKHKDAEALFGQRFDAQSVVRLFDLWNEIPNQIDANETVRELLDPTKKAELIAKVQNLFSKKSPEWINGQEFTLDQLIEEALNEFV